MIEPQSEGASARPANTPPSTAGMTTKVVKGSLWTLAGQVAPLAVSLVATPFTIRLLGAEGYGVLILVSLIPMYLGFADLGMGIASTKFGSEAYAAGDAEKEARTVRTAAALSLLLSVPFAIAIFALAGWIVTLFNVPEHLLGEATLALRVAAFTFVLNFLNQIFNTPQLDRLRMDLNTFVTSGFRILGIAATPIVIYLGGGILGAVIVLFVASLLTLFGHIYVSGRLLPNLWDLSLDRTVIRPLLKFGTALAIASIASVLLVNMEKGVISMTLSMKDLAYYAIAATLSSMIAMLSNSMLQSLVPAFSQLSAPDKTEHLQSVYSRSILLSVMVLVPGSAFLLVIAEPFISIWAGKDFGIHSIWPFNILLFGLLLNIPAYVPYSLLLAQGRTHLVAKLYWLELFPYLVLILGLTYHFGIIGTAIAWSVRMGLDGLLFFGLVRRSIPQKLKAFERFTSSYFITSLVFLGAVVLALGLNAPKVTLLCIFSAMLASYFYVVWSKVLVLPEKDWLRQRLTRSQM